MPSVSVAPSIQRALRNLTAKDPQGIDRDYFKRSMSYAKRDFLPDPYIHLSEGSGKFWDFESDSDYEDLGDAEVLAQAVQTNLRPPPAAISAVPPRPAVAVRPSPAAF